MSLYIKIDSIKSWITQNHIIALHVHNMKLALEILKHLLRIANKHIENMFIVSANNMLINSLN